MGVVRYASIIGGRLIANIVMALAFASIINTSILALSVAYVCANMVLTKNIAQTVMDPESVNQYINHMRPVSEHMGIES